MTNKTHWGFLFLGMILLMVLCQIILWGGFYLVYGCFNPVDISNSTDVVMMVCK